jgi:hypothetical protein
VRKPPTTDCPALRIEAIAAEESAATRGRRRFSASQILDLQISVRLRGRLAPADGSDHGWVRLFSPNGYLYRSFDVTLADPPSASAAAPKRRVPDRREAVLPPLPVAGSAITRNSLYGLWRAEWVDDDGNTCTAGFEVAP